MTTVKCKVIGPRDVAGVATGGTVELNPDEVNIDALIAGGHVQPVSPARKTAAKEGDE